MEVFLFEILKIFNISTSTVQLLISLHDFMSNCCAGCSKCLKKKSSNNSILSLTALIWQIFWKENTISKRFGWCSKSSAYCWTLHFNVPYRLIWTWTTTARVRHVLFFKVRKRLERVVKKLPLEFSYSSIKTRKTQNEHLIIICQNLIGLDLWV